MTRQRKSQYQKHRQRYQREYDAARESLARLKRALDAFDRAGGAGAPLATVEAAMAAALEADRAFEAIPRHLAVAMHVDHDQPWVQVSRVAGLNTGPASFARWGLASSGDTKRNEDRRLRHKRLAKAADENEKDVHWVQALPGVASSRGSRLLDRSYATVNVMGRDGRLLRVHFADEAGVPLVGPGSSPDRYFLKGVSLTWARRILAEHPDWTGELLSAPVLDKNRKPKQTPAGGVELQYFPRLSKYRRIEREVYDKNGQREEPHFMLVIPDEELRRWAEAHGDPLEDPDVRLGPDDVTLDESSTGTED